MRTSRFYHTDLSENKVCLNREESTHARRVLRLQEGSEVELFDGVGGVAHARVTRVGQPVELRVLRRERIAALSPSIDLAAALPKSDRATTLVEKASELGVRRFIPVVTERGVVDPRRGKLERLRRIAVESAKQCGRAWLMEVSDPMVPRSLIDKSDHDVRLFADHADGEEEPQHLMPDGTDSVVVLIGPEGGWTDAERDAALGAGFVSWCFNPHTLRVETAAIAAVAILAAQAYNGTESSC